MLSNISSFNNVSVGGMNPLFSANALPAALSNVAMPARDSSAISADIREAFTSGMSLPGMNNDLGLGFNSGMGMVPGFSSAANLAGSMFGGQAQYSDVYMQMMVLMQMLQMMNAQGMDSAAPSSVSPSSSGHSSSSAGSGKSSAKRSSSSKSGSSSGKKSSGKKSSGESSKTSSSERTSSSSSGKSSESASVKTAAASSRAESISVQSSSGSSSSATVSQGASVSGTRSSSERKTDEFGVIPSIDDPLPEPIATKGEAKDGRVPIDRFEDNPDIPDFIGKGDKAISKEFGEPGDLKNMVDIEVPGGPGGAMKTLKCNRKIADRLTAVYEELQARGLSGNIVEDGGHSFQDRTTRNGNRSLHSWGIAVDVNCAGNAYGQRNQTEEQRLIAQVFAKYGFQQLAYDPMHFQFCLRFPSDK